MLGITPDNTSRWAAAEVDWHGPDSTAPEINEAAALAWYERLRSLGLRPLLTDSNGKGGFHLLVIFREPIPTADAFAFGKWIVSDFAKHGMDAPPETFPKQAKIEPGGYGNWLRVPGRHHTRPHWSRVYNGERWLEGAEAAEFMLALDGDDPALLLWDEIRGTSKPETAKPAKKFTVKATNGEASLPVRIGAYMARLPNLAEGQGRDGVAFTFAAFLVRDVAQTDEDALLWMELWDRSNSPPKGRERLAEIVKNAHAYGKKSVGCGLNAEPSNNGHSAGGAEGEIPPDDANGDDQTPAHLTDMGNAVRLVRLYRSDFRHCFPWKKFLAWDDRRWKLDDTGAATRLAKQAVRELFATATREIQRISEALKAEGANPELEARLVQAHAMQKWALKSEDAKRISAVLDLSRSEPGIPVLMPDLDRDVWLFNCANGTIDLRTGSLHPHQRGDLLTRLCPTPYDPAAKCPRWLKFLDAVFKCNRELIRFVHRLLGRCLSGNVSEQILAIFWGAGANGKSTLINAVLEVMGGDYTMKAPGNLLMASRGERHPTELAHLYGMRLVIASETQQGRNLNEAMIKDLTGGEPIRARRMKEDFWQFPPTHKVIMLTNHKPRVTGSDDGIWRRLRLTPFEERFFDPNEPEAAGDLFRPELVQDKGLQEKLRSEAAGILAWLVQGCLDWKRDGLGLPEIVKAATADYREGEDIIALFVGDCCSVGDLAECRSGTLYTAYEAWSKGNGDKPLSSREFGEGMAKKFHRRKSNGVWYDGVTLNTMPSAFTVEA